MHYHNHLQRTCPVRRFHPLSSLFILHGSQVIPADICSETPGRVHAHYMNAVCNTASTRARKAVGGATIAPNEVADYSLNLRQSQKS